MNDTNQYKITVEKDCITFYVYHPETKREKPMATYPIFLDEKEGALIPIAAFYLLESLNLDGWEEIGESELVRIEGED